MLSLAFISDTCRLNLSPKSFRAKYGSLTAENPVGMPADQGMIGLGTTRSDEACR